VHYEVRFQQVAVHKPDVVLFSDYDEAHAHYEDLIKELGTRLVSVALVSVEALNEWTNPALRPD